MTKIVKTLKLPNSTDEYQINAVALEGMTKTQLDTTLSSKADKSELLKTKFMTVDVANNTYTKITNLGAWGTGTWNKCGLSMLITSRAGETVWLTVSSSAESKVGKAIRLMDAHTKINQILLSPSEDAIYVHAIGWCNNITCSVLLNTYNQFNPTVEVVSSIPEGLSSVSITELGPSLSTTNVGSTAAPLKLLGQGDRPTYNTTTLALSTDAPITHTHTQSQISDFPKTETWKFTLIDGTEVSKVVYIG